MHMYNSLSTQRIGMADKDIGPSPKFKVFQLLNCADRLNFVRQIITSVSKRLPKYRNADSVFGVSIMCRVYIFWFTADY